MVKKLLQKAEAYFYNSQYEPAIEVLKQVSEIAKQGQDWESYIQAKNDLGAVFDYLSKYSEALTHLLEVEQISEKVLAQNHPDRAQTYNLLASVYTSEWKYEQSELYFSKAISILQSIPTHQRELANTYNNKGWYLNRVGKYSQSLELHHLALSIRSKFIQDNPNEVAQSYNNLAGCYIYLGDTNKALVYYRKALAIWRDFFGEQHGETAIAYNNIGWSYSQQADFSTALNFYAKALEIRKQVLGENHVLIAQSLENVAYCLTELSQYDAALDYYQKAFRIRANSVSETHPSMVKVHRNMGTCYLEMKNFDKSFEFLNKALKIYQQHLQKETTERIILYNALGNYYERTQSFSKAIESFHQVLRTSIPDYTTEDVYQTPSLNKYYQSLRLGYAVKHKAKLFLDLYFENGASKNLQASLNHAKTAIRIINENRRSYTTTASKLNHAKLVIETYEWAIYAAYLSYQKTQNQEHFYTAFGFAELSKSYVLFSKLKETEAKISAHVPKEILEKEQNLQIELSSLDKRMQQLQLQSNTTMQTEKKEQMLLTLQSRYFDINLQYEQVIQEIEQNYPQYFQLKYDLQTAHPIDLQEALSKGKVLIDYFIGTENIFIFGISTTQFYFHHLLKPEDLTVIIAYIHDAIGMGDEEDLRDLGEQLYDQLLAPILSPEHQCNQLIIIPDDCLHRLPFDVLMVSGERWTVDGGRWTVDGGRWTENGGRETGDGEQRNGQEEKIAFKPLQTTSNYLETTSCYLIESFQISYHYSATLWLESFKKASNSNLSDSFLGVAPVSFEGMVPQDLNAPISSNYGELVLKSDFDADGTLKELADSKDEIQGIYDLFHAQELEGKMLLYQEATKENFLQQLEGKKYIVLSSHGFYNEENPSLSGIYFARGEQSGERSQEPDDELPVTNDQPLTTNHQPLNNNESMKLYISDTFHLRLDADLVVLSSCESGIGELQKGEGMLALNRGFLYAGAQNIIYSLFKVPDAASQFTPNFFRYLLEEKCSYAEALQKAKLDLIAAGSEPLYWAGFALVGK